jgi:ABC-type glycerol-3-phosphate transport system substrate-binding protein
MKKILALLVFLCFAFTGCNQTTDSKSENIITTTDSSIVETTVTQKTTSTTPSNDDIIKDLFNKKQSDIQVRGSGVVTKILSDDNDGARHQRFILKLNSGQTLLIAHNTDIAPRLEGLAVGEKVEFYGEYYYNSEGGGVHWTHHAPDSNHVSGYLKWNGNIYQSTTTTQETVVGNRNYIGNKNSHVLHVPTCDSLPYEQNRTYFGTIKEALDKGYRKHYECMGN